MVVTLTVCRDVSRDDNTGSPAFCRSLCPLHRIIIIFFFLFFFFFAEEPLLKMMLYVVFETPVRTSMHDLRRDVDASADVITRSSESGEFWLTDLSQLPWHVDTKERHKNSSPRYTLRLAV